MPTSLTSPREVALWRTGPDATSDWRPASCNDENQRPGPSRDGALGTKRGTLAPRSGPVWNNVRTEAIRNAGTQRSDVQMRLGMSGSFLPADTNAFTKGSSEGQ